MALSHSEIESLIRVCAENGVVSVRLGDLEVNFKAVSRRGGPRLSSATMPEGLTAEQEEAVSLVREETEAYDDFWNAPAPDRA